jgi:HK97 family phage major capsid protein
VEQITNDEWKGVSSAGATWYWTTEGVTSTDGAPVLAQPTVPTKKLTGWIPYSVEIGGDYPAFASEMSMVLNSGYNEKVVEGLTTGLGTTAQPTGIVTALEANTNAQVAVVTDGEFHPEDVYALWAALPIKWRRNARWMSSTEIQNEVRQFGENDDANFTVNLLAGEIPQLFGKPYHANDYMDSMVASTSDASLLIVGDWSNFLIAQRVGMTVEVVQHVVDTTTGVPTGQRGLWAWARLGSDSINDLAFRVLSQT